MIKYKDFVAKAMPPEKAKVARRCIIGHYLLRPIDNIISIPLAKLGVEPNTISYISLIPILVSFGVFAMADTVQDFIIGWLLIFIWSILDGVDGNIARYCEKTSVKGALLDAIIGWIAHIAFYSGMGFAAYRFARYLQEPAIYLYIGVLIAHFPLLARLVMHKKAGMVGIQVVDDMKTLNQEKMDLIDIAKLIIFNLASINGVAAVMFLICLLLNEMEICIWIQFFDNLILMLGSIWLLIGREDAF